MKNRKSNALIIGSVIGIVLCAIAEVFLFSNRLREVETQSFTIVASNEVRTMMVGIENWLLPFIIIAILLAVCFFVMSIGFKMKGK